MRLENYGFRKAGRWKLKTGLASGVTFELDDFENDRVVYSFVVGDVPKYIGICEKDHTTLRDRMERYKYLKGGSKHSKKPSTNERIAKNIRQSLNSGEDVDIFALKPRKSRFRYKHKGLKIDLVKGLENPLIKELDPEWNE